MASIKDVAREANVSMATVSYVLNGSKYVSPELTNRVHESVKKLNYKANPMARNLRKKNTNSIGIILLDICNMFFPPILNGFEDYTRTQDYNIVLFNTYGSFEAEKKAILTLLDLWIDGIVIDSCVEENNVNDYIKFLDDNLRLDKRIPILFLERSISKKHSAVIIDNYKAGYEATQHLIDKGRKHIVHLAIDREWRMTMDRKNAYIGAMYDNQLSDNILIQPCGLTPTDGYLAMKKLFDEKKPVDAIFAANDRIALGAVKEVIERKMRIPEDISIVGFDNYFVSNITSPSLTTINVPTRELGYRAGEIIIDLIKSQSKNKAQKILTLPTELIVRESTDKSMQISWELNGW